MTIEDGHPSLHTRRGSAFLWKRVIETLEREIQTGQIKPGEQLPTEASLAQRFRVHENTIRRAISDLQDRGLIRGERGRGSFVREPTLPHELALRTRLSATMRELNLVERRQILSNKTVRATAEVASALRIEERGYLRRVEFINFVDEHPFSLSTHFFPLPRFHGIDAHIAATKSITKSLQFYGIDDYRRLETTIRAITLNAKEAEALQQKRSKPALLMLNTNIDRDDVPIQFTYARLSAAWVELVVKFDGPAA